MLIDVRTYEVRPGTLKAHLDLYAEYGKGPQSKHLGTPLAYLKTETGNPNEYVHMWVYKDAGHREACRAAMWADSDWLAYTKRSAELGALVQQNNRLMVPVDFFDFDAPA
jgi:hypothetical protein|tara:strand:- start:6 stop:335 length:330 start_codon:yes stop_codon:yes gene_type:complete